MMQPSTTWLTRYGIEGASSRYRAYRVVEGLRSFGFECTVEPLATWRDPIPRQLGGLFGRARSLGWPQSSITIVQKEPVNPPSCWPLAMLARRSGRPLVWDIDDAVWIGRRGAHRLALEFASMSDVVVAGNDLLAEWASANGARRVVVIPTCFSPTKQVDLKRHPDELTRYVWIGSPATSELLVSVSPTIEQLVRNPRVRVTFVGGAPPPGVQGHPQVTELPWSPATEHAELSRADYGLAIQPRSEYADHKCGFKVVQYLAYGVVPVATENPVHRTIMQDIGYLVPAGGTLRSELPTEPPPDEDRAAAFERWRSEFAAEVSVDRWASLLKDLDHRS